MAHSRGRSSSHATGPYYDTAKTISLSAKPSLWNTLLEAKKKKVYASRNYCKNLKFSHSANH